MVNEILVQAVDVYFVAGFLRDSCNVHKENLCYEEDVLSKRTAM
jgi:hypothetical protein